MWWYQAGRRFGIVLMVLTTGLVAWSFPLFLEAGVLTQTPQTLHKGLFLVSNPKMPDPHFQKSVILICEYGSAGAIGLVLNKPTKIPLSKVFPSMPGIQKNRQTLFIGGPVQPKGILMLFRSTIAVENTRPVLNEVYWGGNQKMVALMVLHPKPHEQFHIYAGYAGWGRGQLEAEVASGAWKTLPADAANLFEKDPATLWNNLFDSNPDSHRFISYPSPNRP